MPNTLDGIPYPLSSGHTRLWEHLQALADGVQAALPKWVPQVQNLSDSESNVGVVTGDIVNSGTITLPVGWGSMRVVFAGFITVQLNAASARALGVAELAIEVGGTVAVPTYATLVEDLELAAYHEIANPIRFGLPIGPGPVDAAADLPWRLRTAVSTPAAGSQIVVADRALKAIKHRLT